MQIKVKKLIGVSHGVTSRGFPLSLLTKEGRPWPEYQGRSGTMHRGAISCETGYAGRAGTFGPSRNIYVQPGMPALVSTRGHRFALATVGIPDTPPDLQFVFFARNNVALTPLTLLYVLFAFVSTDIMEFVQ